MSSEGFATRRRAAGPAAGHNAGPHAVDAGTNMAVHDLKNLAGRLAFLVKNLSENYEDPLFKGTALDLLQDTVSQLRRLAADLRDHEGRVMIKLRVDVTRLMREALAEVRPDLLRRVRVAEDWGAVPPMWGDSFLLRRAFACAIENALEAMGGHGDLTLATRAQRGRIVAEIKDTGPGFDPQHRPVASMKEDGLGLGVYTMRQVARIHGGSVSLRSAPGAGTRLRFLFPADRG